MYVSITDSRTPQRLLPGLQSQNVYEVDTISDLCSQQHKANYCFYFHMQNLDMTNIKQKLTWDLTLWGHNTVSLGKYLPCFKRIWWFHLHGHIFSWNVWPLKTKTC
jgi:hypothetical protein